MHSWTLDTRIAEVISTGGAPLSSRRSPKQWSFLHPEENPFSQAYLRAASDGYVVRAAPFRRLLLGERRRGGYGFYQVSIPQSHSSSTSRKKEYTERTLIPPDIPSPHRIDALPTVSFFTIYTCLFHFPHTARWLTTFTSWASETRIFHQLLQATPVTGQLATLLVILVDGSFPPAAPRAREAVFRRAHVSSGGSTLTCSGEAHITLITRRYRHAKVGKELLESHHGPRVVHAHNRLL